MANYKLYPRETFTRFLSTGTRTNQDGEKFQCFGTRAETRVSQNDRVEVNPTRSFAISNPDEPRVAAPAPVEPVEAEHGVHFDPQGEDFWIL